MNNSSFRSEIRSSIADGPNTENLWNVDNYILLSMETLSDTIKALPVGEFLWVKADLWCQKGFDFLCFWKCVSANKATNLNMVVANATIAKSHSIRLDEVKKLASALGQEDCVVTAIRFDFIVPDGAEFTFGNITGRLCEWKDLHSGLNWPNSSSSEGYCNCDIQCLAVAYVARTSLY